jgi:hypothetical protein
MLQAQTQPAGNGGSAAPRTGVGTAPAAGATAGTPTSPNLTPPNTPVPNTPNLTPPGNPSPTPPESPNLTTPANPNIVPNNNGNAGTTGNANNGVMAPSGSPTNQFRRGDGDADDSTTGRFRGDGNLPAETNQFRDRNDGLSRTNGGFRGTNGFFYRAPGAGTNGFNRGVGTNNIPPVGSATNDAVIPSR